MGSSKQHERTGERQYALQVLYQADILGQDPADLIKEDLLADDTKYLGEYAKGLLSGVQANKDQLDEQLANASDNWSVERMPAVDRSLLRLAAYEMLFVEDVPISVSINEAVNLAKLFGGDDSPRFINGILGRIAHSIEDGEVPSGPSQAADAPVGSEDAEVPADTAEAADAPAGSKGTA